MHGLNSARFRLPIPEVHASSMLTNISFDYWEKGNLGTDILACLEHPYSIRCIPTTPIP